MINRNGSACGLADGGDACSRSTLDGKTAGDANRAIGGGETSVAPGSSTFGSGRYGLQIRVRAEGKITGDRTLGASIEFSGNNALTRRG